MHSSQQTLKCPGQVGRAEGWGRQCCDGGGVSGEASQVKGRSRPRTSPEVLPPSSWGLRGEGQSEAECSGRAGPRAEQKQTQASWCRPEAVLPITCLPGLQKKTLIANFQHPAFFPSSRRKTGSQDEPRAAENGPRALTLHSPTQQQKMLTIGMCLHNQHPSEMSFAPM